MRAKTLGLTLTTLAVAAVPALAAAPKPGLELTGTTSQGKPVTARVTADGKGLRMTFRTTFTCSDGRTPTVTSTFKRDVPKISSTGRITLTKTYRDLPGSTVIKGADEVDETQRIRGSFSKAGRSFKLTTSFRVVGEGVTCTQKGTVSAAVR